MKNCGSPVHEYVATRDFMEEMMEVLKKTSNEEVQKRILMLLAAWVYAFRSEPKYRVVQVIFHRTKKDNILTIYYLRIQLIF